MVRHPLSFAGLVALWSVMQFSGVDAFLAPLAGACLGFPLVFHRTMTPAAPLGRDLLLGALTSIGALVLLVVVSGAGAAAVAMLLAAAGPDLALVSLLAELAALVALLAAQFAAPALSFHDRRLRGLKAWRISLGQFGPFLIAAGLVLLSLAGLGTAALLFNGLLSGLAVTGWAATSLEVAGRAIPGAFAVAVPGGAMASMTLQSLAEAPDQLAEVFA